MSKKKKTTKGSFQKGFGSGFLLALLIAFGGYLVYQGTREDQGKNEKNEEESRNSNLESGKKVEEESGIGNQESGKEDEKKEENKKEIGGSGDKETDAEINKEAEKVTENEQSGAMTKVYQNEDYAYTVNFPENWQKEESGGQIGFLPAEKKTTGNFNGDIIINHKENPDKLTIKEHYDGKKDVNLLEDAQDGFEEIKNGYLEAYKFKNVQGYVPSTVVVIRTINGFVEITDVGSKHQKDGVFDQMVASFNVK